LTSVFSVESSPEKIFQLVWQAIGIVFDVQGGVVLKPGPNASFQRVSLFGSLAANIQEIQLAKHPGFEALNQGSPLSLEETYSILSLGYSSDVNRVQSFPILCKGQLAWVLQILNTPLEPDNLELLQAYCRHLGVLLENILLRQEMQA